MEDFRIEWFAGRHTMSQRRKSPARQVLADNQPQGGRRRAPGGNRELGQRVEGRRPDLTIVDDRTRLDEGLGDITAVIDANLGVRPVYVTRVDQNELVQLFDRYNLTPLASPVAGNVFRVTPKVSAAPQDQP
jgi:hypothetical protein